MVRLSNRLVTFLNSIKGFSIGLYMRKEVTT